MIQSAAHGRSNGGLNGAIDLAVSDLKGLNAHSFPNELSKTGDYKSF